MPQVGPQLPPHLRSKRKHEDEDWKPSHTAPPEANGSSPDGAVKRRRVVGPAAPSEPLDERAMASDEDEDNKDDSSSEDEYGPTPPKRDTSNKDRHETISIFDRVKPQADTQTKKAARDEWMTLPPKQDDLAARMDPTKTRARKFNTGKGAKGPSAAGGADNAMWTETPDEKRRRLADEVLGIVPAASSSTETIRDRKLQAEDEEKERKIMEHNQKHRARSLYEQHQGATKKEKEDDPSERAFDYEKDMGGGTKIGHAQRREMLNKASDFGSRFSKGSYL